MKKILSVILISILIISSMPMSVFAEELLLTEVVAPGYYTTSSTATLNSTIDTEALKEYLLSNTMTCVSSIDVSDYGLKTTDADAISNLLYLETPIAFHVRGYSYAYYSDGSIAYIKPKYIFSETEYPVKLKEFQAAANKLLSGVKGNDNLSDLEKLLILHDRLAVWTEYDVDFSTGEQMYTAYGILVAREGVCMGYALAYDYLLEQVGIENHFCNSAAHDHAWNTVKLNEEWYHVDVTWDDPTYDKTGRVTHDNFLRSTEGIIASGHNKGTDFDTTPTDTTYDSYYWQNSNTEFQLIGNDIYYLDNSTATINKLTDSGTETVVSGLDTRWYVSGLYGSFYSDCYSMLSSDGECLYYSNAQKIHKYDPETETTSVAWDLSSNDYKIYGFKWEDCKFYCDMFNSPNFEETTKTDNQISTVWHKTNSTSDKWVIDTFATSSSEGIKYNICSNCGKCSEISATTNTIGTACVVSNDGKSIIDYDNKIIITPIEMCNDIASIITLGNTATSNIVASYTQGNLNLIGTGSTYNIEIGNEKVTFTVITDGDLNGDSVCDVLDSSAAAIYLNGKKTPTKEELYAANGEAAEAIDITVYQSLINKVVA